MAVTDAVLGFIADIGIEAARKQYNIKQNEYQVRAKLTDYLVRQQKYNFDCSLEEESIGVQGVQTRLKRNVRFESK